MWARLLRRLRVAIHTFKERFRRPPTVPLRIERGFVTAEQLEGARKAQQNAQPFEKVLIELGMVGEREVLQAKAQAMGLPFVDLERTPVETDTASLISGELAIRHSAIVIKRVDKTLWVAMSNPTSLRAIDEISTITKCRVVPVLAVPDLIAKAISEHYRSS